MRARRSWPSWREENGLRPSLSRRVAAFLLSFPELSKAEPPRKALNQIHKRLAHSMSIAGNPGRSSSCPMQLPSKHAESRLLFSLPFRSSLLPNSITQKITRKLSIKQTSKQVYLSNYVSGLTQRDQITEQTKTHNTSPSPPHSSFSFNRSPPHPFHS